MAKVKSEVDTDDDDELSSSSSSSDSDGEDEGDEEEIDVLHRFWFTDKEKKQKFREEVGKWKTGRWTYKEVSLLKENVKTFMERNHVKDVAHLIYHGEKKDRSNFYRFIAQGIKRPLFQVYRKAYREYDVGNYVGKWSQEMEQELLKLHTIHGNHWAIIGQSLGISARSARDKHRNITNRQRTGLWRPQEEARLTAAMKQMQSESGSEEMELHPSGTWEQVAKLVGSRNAHQCRQKWMHYMAPRILEGKWTCKDDLHLLEELEKRDEAEDEDDIDWLELSSAWNNARTPYYLRKKWSSLRRGVPNYSIRPFQGKDVLCLKKLLTCLAF